MAVSVGAFNHLIRPDLRKNFRDNYDTGEEEWSQFLKRGTMDMPEMSATIMTGVSRMYERGDLEPVRFETPVLGPKVSGISKEFAVGVAIGRQVMEDEQYGKMKESGKWLANAARQTYEYRGAALLDDAFAGSTFKGIDGLALCHTAHTILNSASTYANRPAVDVGMSMTGMTAILDLFGLLKNHDGDPINMMPDTLVIGNNAGDIHTAMQILRNTKEPFTADNNDNIIKQRVGGMKLVVSRYKTSTKSYFAVDSKWNDAHLLVRRAVRLDDEMDFKTDAALFKVSTRFMIWFVDPRGWVGVNPS